MTSSKFKLPELTFHRLLFSVLILGIFYIMTKGTFDPDMWWHLKTGEWIVQQGIPKTDPFSWTFQGSPWITHEWLSEVFLWGCFHLGGLPFLILSAAAVGMLVSALLYRQLPGKSYLKICLVMAAMSVIAPFWSPRPLIFTLFLLLIFLETLRKVRLGKSSSLRLFIFPILMILWVNLHGGYLVGIALTGYYLAADFLQKVFFRRIFPEKYFLRLSQALGFSLGASLFNPNGWKLWIYPFQTLFSKSMQAYIAEWQSPDFHTPLFLLYGGFVLFSLLGLILNRRSKTDFSELLLYFGFLAMSFISARHIPIFIIIAVKPTFENWHEFLNSFQGDPACSSRELPISAGRNYFHWLLVTAGVVGYFVYAAHVFSQNDAKIAKVYPVKAVEFLKQNQLDETKLFNVYGWGGYLIWKGIPPFIDGRADVYGDQFMEDYVAVQRLTEKWSEVLERYKVDYLLLEKESPAAVFFRESPAWKSVYQDSLAEIFARAGTV